MATREQLDLGSLADRVLDVATSAVEQTREFLASEEGKRLRSTVATGLIAAAPFVSQLPALRATRFGRLLGLTGGAAALVKVAEMIRDWEPAPARGPRGDPT